ncbi:MAG TPA: hypothetical protein VJR48_11000, partial [Ktedonobacterales bacterium]|nr:hypothetical protein [Ktedonobacterales bacterium]
MRRVIDEDENATAARPLLMCVVCDAMSLSHERAPVSCPKNFIAEPSLDVPTIILYRVSNNISGQLAYTLSHLAH